MNATDFGDYIDFGDDWDDDDWDDPDCGLTDKGFCYDIGTEHCSFFCPYSHLIVPNAEPPPELAKSAKGEIPF